VKQREVERARYLEAGAADELDPVAAPECLDLRRVVPGDAGAAGVGNGGCRGPHSRVGGEERRRRDRDGCHCFSSRGQAARATSTLHTGGVDGSENGKYLFPMVPFPFRNSAPVGGNGPCPLI
jgi:hypothetical protein